MALATDVPHVFDASLTTTRLAGCRSSTLAHPAREHCLPLADWARHGPAIALSAFDDSCRTRHLVFELLLLELRWLLKVETPSIDIPDFDSRARLAASLWSLTGDDLPCLVKRGQTNRVQRHRRRLLQGDVRTEVLHVVLLYRLGVELEPTTNLRFREAAGRRCSAIKEPLDRPGLDPAVSIRASNPRSWGDLAVSGQFFELSRRDRASLAVSRFHVPIRHLVLPQGEFVVRA